MAAQIKSQLEDSEHCCQRPKMDLEDAPQEDPNAGLSVGTVHAAFILSAAVAVALTFGKDLIKGKLSMNSDVGGQTPQFKAFQRTYLTVYLLMMAGDWLQGPYMYALYDAYGFKHEEIAALFVAGFFSARTSNFNLYAWSSLADMRECRRWRAGGVPSMTVAHPVASRAGRSENSHKRVSWAPAGARVATIAAGARGMRSVDEGPHSPGHAPAALRESGRAAERVKAGAAGAAHTHIGRTRSRKSWAKARWPSRPRRSDEALRAPGSADTNTESGHVASMSGRRHTHTRSRKSDTENKKKQQNTGFGSSMLFGTVAGSLADTLGRKRGALAYVVVYAASCVTKHWRSYEVLMFGRVLGGIATSLLFSVFDSWLVAEHASRGFEPAWLSTTFANAQAGNSIVAILSGVLGEWIAGTTPMRVLVAGSTGGEDAAPDGAIMWGGYCLPFDAAAVFLLVGGFVIMTTWNENYGDTKQSSGADGLRESLTKGLLLLARDRRVLLVGLVCSCFEAAMYAFVFEWTPALTAANAPR